MFLNFKKSFYCLVAFIFGAMPVAVFSAELDQEMVDRASSLHTNVGTHYSDTNSLQQNVTHPVTSSDVLRTADGTEFNAQIGCKSSNTFMKVLVIPNSSGEANFNIEIDKNMDNAIDTVVSEENVSGICSNGFIRCDIGSWNNCIGYKWFVDSGMNMSPSSLEGQDFTEELKSCYCINNSCGSNLVLTNMANIVKDFGTGLANAFQQRDPYYTISAVTQDGPYTTFYGQEPASCAVGFNSSLTTYKDSPGSLSSAAFSTSTSDDLYNQVTNSVAASNESTTLASCSIEREIVIEEIEITDIIEFVSGTGSLSYCGVNCIELTVGQDGDNYWNGSCTAFDTTTRFNVKQPQLINSATLVRARYDDWMYISNNNQKVYAGPYDWNGGLSQPSGYSCELSTGWNVTPNLDFTDTFNTAGIVEFNTRTLVSGGGEGYAKIRIYVDLEQSVDFDVNIGAPGDDYLSYSFDLINDSSSVVSKDSVWGSTIELPQNIDFQHLCDEGYEFNLISKVPWNPPAPYDSPNFDTTIDLTSIQLPSCENGLRGEILVEDQTSSDFDNDWTLGGKFSYRATKPACGVSSEVLDNSCVALESNSSCSLMDETIDGVSTFSTFVQTNLLPISQTQTLTSGACTLHVTRPWFNVERTYSCENTTSSYDFSFAQNRLNTITGSTTSEGYNDVRVDSLGVMTNSSNLLSIPETPTVPGCVQSCKTRKLKVDTQLNALGVASSNRLDPTMYEFFYHQCSVDSACPVGEGEEVVTSCQCINSFNETATMVQALRLAGSDMVCTSGVGQSIQ